MYIPAILVFTTLLTSTGSALPTTTSTSLGTDMETNTHVDTNTYMNREVCILHLHLPLTHNHNVGSVCADTELLQALPIIVGTGAWDGLVGSAAGTFTSASTSTSTSAPPASAAVARDGTPAADVPDGPAGVAPDPNTKTKRHDKPYDPSTYECSDTRRGVLVCRYGFCSPYEWCTTDKKCVNVHGMPQCAFVAVEDGF